MNIQEKTLEVLEKNVEVMNKMMALLESRDCEYAYGAEAVRILGVTNERDLKPLRERGHIVKFTKIGRLFRYDKRELYVVAYKIQSGKIRVK